MAMRRGTSAMAEKTTATDRMIVRIRPFIASAPRHLRPAVPPDDLPFYEEVLIRNDEDVNQAREREEGNHEPGIDDVQLHCEGHGGNDGDFRPKLEEGPEIRRCRCREPRRAPAVEDGHIDAAEDLQEQHP